MKRTLINLGTNLVSMVLNIAIGFWLSPYVVSHIGVEANGFVTLATNFTTYAGLIVTALNSMASRFIGIEYIKKNYQKANMYYNSVFWGNLIIVAVLLPVAILIVCYLEFIVNVPGNILFDVKILFSLVFFNFFIHTGVPNWECSTFITNRLDRSNIPGMSITVFRCFFLIAVMTIFEPHVWFVGLAATIVMVITLYVGWYNTKKLTPELYIEKHRFLCSWSAIKELVGSGIWYSVASLGNILFSGFDLLICNIFIDATNMGVLSLAKILPSYLSNLSTNIFNAFNPEILINYATGDKSRLSHDLKRSMKIMSALVSVLLCGIIVMGKDFYRLWVPSQDASLLYRLTILMCIGHAITSGTSILNAVFTTVNKVRTHSIVVIICGAISIIGSLVLLKVVPFGIYVIAGFSVLVDVMRIQIYVIPKSTYYLQISSKPFYFHEVICLVDLAVLCIVSLIIRSLFTINSWFDFFAVAVIIGSISLAMNFFIFLKKSEQKALLDSIKHKFGKRES